MDFVSDGCADLTGYEPDSIESGAVSWGEDVIHPDDRVDVWDSVGHDVDAGESFTVTYRIVTAADETKWVWEQGSPVYDDGDLAFLEGFVADVTGRYDRRAALREERAVTEHALDALEDAFLVVDHETGALRRWNDRITEFTGYTDDELAEMTIFDLVPDDRVDDVIDATEATLEGDDRPLELPVVDRHGERVPLEIRGAPIRDDDGDLIGFGSIARDVSDRKRREKRLEQFASVLSHDLRDPLHVIQGRVDLARETDDPTHLDRIAEATDRMDEMIDDLFALALEGQTIGDREPCEVATVAREAWRTVGTGDAVLAIEDPGAVDADRGRLRDALANLFRNSVEHSSTSPHSQAREDAVEQSSTNPRSASPHEDAVEHGESAPGSSTSDRAGDRADAATAETLDQDGEAPPVRVFVGGLDEGFYVADDGPGIPPGDQETVFEHGFTTTDDGTGLGLSIVRGVAEAHGWSVAVTDGRHGGARFEFET